MAGKNPTILQKAQVLTGGAGGFWERLRISLSESSASVLSSCLILPSA